MAYKNDLVHSWVIRELAVWKAAQRNHDTILSEIDLLSRKHKSIFIIAIKDGEVHVRDKPNLFAEDEMERNSVNNYITRIQWYRKFIQRIIENRHLTLTATLAIDTADLGDGSSISPIFVFAKRIGSPGILLPDIHFLKHDFYQSSIYKDQSEFKDKKDKAFFVGSTTGGGILTLEKLKEQSVPRIGSAAYFRNSNLVDFKFSHIVQCASEEVADAIRAMGFNSPVVPWQEQFQNKAIISMDGNGPTWSRVVVALKSNSVLLKYDSPYTLYWYDGLLPWFHYIPITTDADVERAIRLECQEPGILEFIARNGTHFYESYLTEEHVIDYTARLLKEYENTFFK
jgi:hypothetical protein